MRWDGSDVRQLTDDAFEEATPAFAPSGAPAGRPATPLRGEDHSTAFRRPNL